jgi:hypothetical protein
MTDDRGPRVFDMPHARVTLTQVGPGIEIEVWPKSGQSSYAVVDPTVAILIAQELVELAAARLTAPKLAHEPASTGSGDEDAPDAVIDPAPDNIVDLASRRPSPRGPS